MVIRLELHIKYAPVHSETQDISDYDLRLPERINVEIREYQVKLWAQKIWIENARKIDNAEGQAQIYVFIESRGNEMEFEDEIAINE